MALALILGLALACIYTMVPHLIEFRTALSDLDPRRHPREQAPRGPLVMFFVSALGGIAVAVGAAPGGVAAVAGSFIGCMAARALLRDEDGARPFGRGLVWFTVICWCLMVAPGAHRTADVASSLAAQAVQGPLPLSSDPMRAVPAWVAMLVGLAASGWWCRHQRGVGNGGAQRWMPAAEAALCGVAISQTLWGPSALVLLRGPLSGRPLAWGISGLLVGVAAVAVVTLARDKLPAERPSYMWVALGAAAVALGSSLVGAWA